MNKKLSFKFVLFTVITALLLSLGGAAFAVTTDPYLDAYDDALRTPVRTYVLDNEGTEVLFFVSPRAIDAPDAPPTYFSSEEDALAAADTINVVLDTPPSLSGTELIYPEAVEINPGEWAVQVYVAVNDDQSYGSLSVETTNPGSTSGENYINVTIARQEEEPPAYTSADQIEVRVYHPQQFTTYTATGLTVQNIDFYENPLRTFPTALDALIHAGYYDSDFYAHVTRINTGYLPSTGYYVDSITLDGTEYGTLRYDGWQYRVYRGGPNQPKVQLSEVVFSDSFMLLPGDVVVWAYGRFDSESLFPPHLDLPGPANPAAPEVTANPEG